MTGRRFSATLALFLLVGRLRHRRCHSGSRDDGPLRGGDDKDGPESRTGGSDQQFGLDEIAEYPDGLEIEVAGVQATRAEAKDRGAENTRGEMIPASIRIGNGRELPYETTAVRVFVTYGNGTLAPAVVDATSAVPPGFTAAVPPGEEATAPVAFAVPFDALGKVTFTVDPGDDQHEPVSFTGKVQRE